MSDWHREMQEFFDKQYREVVCNYRGQIHRADILKDGVVIEFQHSPLSAEEYIARNRFYMGMGYKVVWVFDVSDAFDNRNLYYDDCYGYQNLMRWKYAKQMLRYSPHISDFNNQFALYLWFESDEDEIYLQKVIWSSHDNEGIYDFNRIMLSKYTYILERNMDPNTLFLNKQDFLKARLAEVKPYTIKKIGITGSRRNAYVCPKSKKFGLKVNGEKGCSYCRYCGAIEEVERDGRNCKYNVYCCYPKQVNKVINSEPNEYECDAPIF